MKKIRGSLAVVSKFWKDPTINTKVELTDIGKEFMGRLKIKYRYKFNQTRPYMKSHYNEFKVNFLPSPYTGRSFPGF